MTQGVYERDWLRWGIDWLAPTPCKCGDPRVVCWTAWAQQKTDGRRWHTMCHKCDRKRVQAGDTNHYVLIYEVDPTRLRPAGARVNAGLHVWMRESGSLSTEILTAVVQSFAHLERARYVYANTPREEWALEVRDGEVWAPWNPASGVYKSGPPMKLRQTTLRKAKWSRSCSVCTEALQPGARPWKPKPVVGEQGWPAGDRDKFLACSTCVAKALVIDAPEPGVMVGHLRVLTGNESA